ncbi:AMP-binding enzyme family protein [Aspergillus niger]|uniref:AMP-binding enzyme family protein n=3 Tax=Aspergillus niger TaxID=5061 RepID=A0A505I019_ASPNG|nr:hypothetical protein M747DRAFT_370068 [Aspergillus niger ATCC 13496]TPR05301.1 AMP-binding enzyme family protein [Aspergillus niger]
MPDLLALGPSSPPFNLILSLEICCDGPHEYEWTLRAFFADDLSVNILTPLGRQRLGMPPAREGSEKEIQIMKGKVTTVRQCITLRIWLRSSKISEEEDFYLLEDLDAGIPTGAHAILRRSSSINAEMNPDKHPSLSPIFGSLKTKVDKEKEDKRHAEGGSKALEAENRRREIASALRQPARESRGSQDPGARR